MQKKKSQTGGGDGIYVDPKHKQSPSLSRYLLQALAEPRDALKTIIKMLTFLALSKNDTQ